ncbi:S49 family peptidase [Duganella sp. BJB476]|uniref:S49 family peptidase n=1 Tax=Duganella sp. BJB476 TaxID=1871176 RepID=UPI001E4D81B5|nr:S49 family peptidase [Duganella sp. BJB476]
MSGVLRRWSAGQPASPEVMAEVEAAQAARGARAKATANVGGGIAVLSLYGVMSQRASMVDDISGAGGTSTQAFTQSLRAALADDSISGIIIDIDSPGGSVFGTAELAAEIMSARGTKPIYGFVNSLCASAAYWTGSQCEQLFITPGGQAGSIGVYMQHVDESAALDAEGYKVNYISAGKYKVEGNSLGPLDDEALSFLQSQVNSYYQSFTSAVAKGRGAPVASVRDGMGQGRCLLAADALAAGMVDGICTMDDVIKKMQKAIKGTAGARADDVALPVAAEIQAPAAPVAADDPVAPSGAPAAHAARAAARRRALELAGL